MANRWTLFVIALASMLLVSALSQTRERPNRPRGSTTAQAPQKPEDVIGKSANVRVVPRAVAKAKSPGSRAQTITALLGNAETKKSLDKAVTGTALKSSQLGTMTLSGRTVPAGTTAMHPTDVPTTIPTIDQMNWEAGVHFSPWGCPRYQEGGETHHLGCMTIFGVFTSYNLSLDQMEQDGVVLLSRNPIPTTFVVGRLPPGTHSYLVTIKMVPANGTAVDSWMAENPDGLWCLAGHGHGDGSTVLDLVPLADGSGLAGVVTMSPIGGDFPYQSESCDMDVHDFSILIDSWGEEVGFGRNMLFGGIILTRL